MGDDTEWMKLPTDEKCVHKAWKARAAGYEEATKQFKMLDEKSPEFSKYLGILKKFVVDSNAITQEKGLEAVLAYVENAHIAPKTACEVTGGIITKCLNASRAKTKERAAEILLMYIEIEKQELIMEELTKGLSNKQPKVVSGCIQCIRSALSGFGNKTIPIKPLVKLIHPKLEDRDPTVREEMKQLVVEMYRWVGPALKPQLAALKPVQLTELEAEFEKLGGGKPQQTRYLRSQQDLKAKAEAVAAAREAAGGDADEGDGEVEEEEAIDPYELMTPVDIIPKLPKDFFEKIEAKKWQERREVLDAVLKLTADHPRLEKSDYGDLVRSLKKVVAKDSNVMLVTAAAKCIGGLATGLRKKFAPYASDCIDAMIEKFREKKVTVVAALRDAVDAAYLSTTLEAISESCIAYLEHKTPSVKAETAAYLGRCFSKCTPTTLPKKLLKAFAAPLLKTVADTAPEVREASFIALGTAMKVVGEKPLAPFLADIDPLKMTKIKECCEKAEVLGKSGKPVAPKAEKAAPAAAKPTQPAKKSADSKPGGAPKAKAAGGRPKTAPGKAAGGKKAAAKKPTQAEIIEPALSDEAVEEKAGQLIPGDALTGLVNANWKNRLAAMETITQVVKRTCRDDIPCQALVRTLTKKPGLKDNNFQVMKWKVELISHLACNSVFTKCSGEVCITDLTDKIGDVKNGEGIQEALSCIAEACSLEFVSIEVLSYALDRQKNPKNQAEALNWLATAIKLFGFKVPVKPVVEYIKKSLAATNPAIRSAGVALLGVMYMYMGAPLRMLFDGEKAALLQNIDAEIDKVKGEKPPTPTRGLSKHGGAGGGGGDEEEEEAGEEDGADAGVNVADLVPRNDISGQITEDLITEMADKNWKIRNEALQKVTSILNEAKFITPNLGSLPEALKLRLGDSNKILVTSTINICSVIGTAMGPAVKQHVRVIGPGFISCLGDSKPAIRAAAVGCLNGWVEQGGLPPFVEAEIFSDALKTESPSLRTELLGWLADKLPGVKKKLPKEELTYCLPYVYSCLEDRSADVRKKAQEALMPFMIHLGWDTMVKQAGKLKTSSKDPVMAHLEKARAALPAKPARAAPAPTPAAVSAPAAAADLGDEDEEDQTRPSTAPAKGGAKVVNGKGKAGPAKKGGKAAPAPSSKKKDEDDEGVPLKVSNGKEQRFKDEKTLRVLKWNFASPRVEFLDQLRSQMEPTFSKTLVEQVFHTDFKNHIKAIETLTKSCEMDAQASIANLDLLLKWTTLRFYDTNTSVLLKVMEYLQIVFSMLSAEDYHLHELEAIAFIPYLINKVGDPKDNVRKAVRTICNRICKVYPASKMFSYIIDGLKSKNARQRTECLEELGLLIETYGVNVCQPSPAQALKLMAQQIADRDNNVRSAALNSIVIIYFILGDATYKYLGSLSDKDAGMLEERIKRSSKTKPSQPPPASKQLSPDDRPTTAARTNKQQQSKLIEEPSPEANSPSKNYLDFDDGEPIRYEMPNLIAIDMDGVMDQTVQLPVTKTRRQVTNMQMLRSSSDVKSTLDVVISLIGSNDIQSSLQSLHQVDELLKCEDKVDVLLPHVDQLLVVTALQLRMAYSKHMADNNTDKTLVVSLYRCLLATLVSLFHRPSLAKEASTDILKDLLFNLITVLLDNRLNELDDGSLIIRSVNVMVVKVVEKGDYTNVTSALIRLLKETVEIQASSPKFVELTMKCLWKMVRYLPKVINELNVDKTLFEVHKFWVRFPASSWKERKSDTPLRTLQTLLHTLAKSMGTKIMNHLTLIEHPESSEVVAYLRKVLKTVVDREKNAGDRVNGVTDNAKTEKAKSSSKRLSVSTHDILAVIFKKIGSKENTREGLNDLYDFKLKYPEADLEPFLKKCSSFFQNYIERGLKNIEIDRKANLKPSASAPIMAKSSSCSSISSTCSAPAGDTTPDEASVLMDRLKVLRARCGLENNSQKDDASLKSSNPEQTGSTSSLTSSNYGSMPHLSGKITSASDEDAPKATLSNNNPGETVDSLRKRLERLKNQAK